MASMRDIKRRKSSIQSTQQITKAMKLVSTVKLQKARSHAEQTDPYFQHMYQTVTSILARSGNMDHPYLAENGSDKIAVVVITANRGLAGGYNSNIIKLVQTSGLPKEKVLLYTIGTKGKDALERRGYQVTLDASDVIESPAYRDAMEICDKVLKDFAEGKIGQIYIAYTHFKNTVVHVPTFMKLLPVEFSETEMKAADKT